MVEDRLPVEAATTATGARTIATQIADTMAVTWRPLSRCDFVSCSTGSPVRCRSDLRGQCVSAGATTFHEGLLELGIKRLDRCWLPDTRKKTRPDHCRDSDFRRS